MVSSFVYRIWTWTRTAMVESSKDEGLMIQRCTYTRTQTRLCALHIVYTSNTPNTQEYQITTIIHRNFWELEYKLWIINFLADEQECFVAMAVAVSMSLKWFCCYYNYVSNGIEIFWYVAKEIMTRPARSTRLLIWAQWSLNMHYEICWWSY